MTPTEPQRTRNRTALERHRLLIIEEKRNHYRRLGIEMERAESIAPTAEVTDTPTHDQLPLL